MTRLNLEIMIISLYGPLERERFPENMQALQRWMNRGLKYLKLSNSLKTALRSQGLENLQEIMNKMLVPKKNLPKM